MSTTVPAIKRKQDLKVAGNVLVQGNSVWHAGNLAKSEFTSSSHVGTGGNSHAAVTTTVDGFMLAADKVKLDAIQANAINQTTADGRYLKLSGGILSGDLTINNVGNSRLILNADTDNDVSEVGEPKLILTQDGGITGAEVKLTQGGANDGALVLAPFTNYSTSPINSFLVYIHDKLIWHEGTFNPSTKLDATHNGTGGASHAAVTSTVNGFMIAADKVKLDGISVNAKKVESSTTNGNIKIDSVETNVYTHPTTDGNKHLPSGGATGQWVKWSSAGTGAWTGITWTDIASKPTSTVANIDDAVAKRHTQNTDTGTTAQVFSINSGGDSTASASGISFGAASKAYIRWNLTGFELYKDFNATTKVWSDVKANSFYNKDGVEVSYEDHLHQWSEIQNKPATFTPPIATSTVLGGVKQGTNISISADGTLSGAYSLATQGAQGLMSNTDKTKLDGVSTNAKKVAQSVTNGNILIDDVQTVVYTHPSGDGNLHVPATGTGSNGKFLKSGTTAGSISWNQVSFTDIDGSITDVQHGQRGGGSLHTAVTTSTNGFMIAADKTKLDGIADSANNYVHPATHSLDVITETTTKKIMTDIERTKLSGIENSANNYTHPATHSLDVITETTTKKIMTDVERTKLAGIENGANNYTHPATHSLDVITETTTKRL
jgi:hypothetical protein